MCDKHKGFIGNDSEGGVAARHPPLPVSPVLVGRTIADRRNTIKAVLFPIACWRLDDLRFESGCSFVKPEATQELMNLAVLRQGHTGAPVSIFGHADPVGDDEKNKKLSGRRAAAV